MNQELEQQLQAVIGTSENLEKLAKNYRELAQLLDDSDDVELPEEIKDSLTDTAQGLEQECSQFQNDVELLMRQISEVDHTLYLN